jgi:hypothetical protein
MRVLTISEGDDEGIDDGEPLLVARVDGPLIRRLLALVVDELAAPPSAALRPGPRPGALHPLRPISVRPESISDPDD